MSYLLLFEVSQMRTGGLKQGGHMLTVTEPVRGSQGVFVQDKNEPRAEKVVAFPPRSQGQLGQW